MSATNGEGPALLGAGPSGFDSASDGSIKLVNTPNSNPLQRAPLLRDYQLDVIKDVHAQIAAGRRRILIVAPTGSGKTVIAADIIQSETEKNRRVLVLAHRRELVAQAHQKLYDTGIDAGVIQAGFRPRPEQPVQVASVATLHARAVRTHNIEMPAADLVVVDEAHHVRAKTYKKILERYPNAAVIGLTATPCRGDGRGLGNCFGVIIECPPVAKLTADGYLVPARVFAPSRPDLTGVSVQRGDYVESQLVKRVDTTELVGDIVEHWLKLAERRRTVCFATGVGHSLHIRDEFRRAGVVAEHIDGDTPVAERDTILKRLAAGTVDIVSNAMVLTEGWDCPEVSCLILARPTKSMGLFRQMVGRVLRPAPGKTDALILDHAGAVFTHGFVDDEIVWTLHEDRRAENSSHARREASPASRITTCPECKAVRFSGRPCSVCGWRARTKAESYDVASGELGEVGRDRTVTAPKYDGEQFYRELLGIARERGYARGWAAHKYREKFGTWPRWRYASPAAPTDTTRAWVRSRAIAYAKAMQKAGAA